MRKVFASSAAASLLAFNTLPAVASASTAGEALTNPKIASSSAILNVAPFASLAEVRLLENVNVDATLNQPADGEDYDLALNLSGTGVANVEALNPDRVVAFSIPELAGQMYQKGSADVSVDLTAITMDDIPAVGGLVTTLTGS